MRLQQFKEDTMSNWIPGARPKSLSVQQHRQRGFTLIEIMMSVVLVAISVALAIPSYREMVEKRQLTNAAEQLASFVNVAQTISSRTNQIVTVSFNHVDANDWCIGATMGAAACDCDETDASQSTYCEIDSEPFVLNANLAVEGDLMHDIKGDGAYSFDPIRGLFLDTDDSLTMEMQTRSGDYKLNLVVNSTGRVTLCSNDASHAIPGYYVCPSEEESS
jgi:type IV fimbrial biogenesis protein FimT